MIEAAYAMGQAGGGSPSGASGFASFIPLILMFVIFYFLLIRPQQKKNKEHREMIENLKIGNRIIISGGIHGRINNVSDDVLTVEIADKVKVKISRNSVSSLLKIKSNLPNEKLNKSEENNSNKSIKSKE